MAPQWRIHELAIESVIRDNERLLNRCPAAETVRISISSFGSVSLLGCKSKVTSQGEQMGHRTQVAEETSGPGTS